MLELPTSITRTPNWGALHMSTTLPVTVMGPDPVGWHQPDWQVRFVPQVVPSATGVPVSAHAGVPLQVVTPVWQAFAGVQAWPATQAVAPRRV
jgi:hypothetical protein